MIITLLILNTAFCNPKASTVSQLVESPNKVGHLINYGPPGSATASEMTYIVSSGALNSTHSLTHSQLSPPQGLQPLGLG